MGSEPLTITLVAKIAGREGVDPIDLTPPINSSIDIDALKKLFDGDKDGFVRIEFTYGGHRVTIENDEEFRIEAE